MLRSGAPAFFHLPLVKMLRRAATSLLPRLVQQSAAPASLGAQTLGESLLGLQQQQERDQPSAVIPPSFKEFRRCKRA